MKISQLTHLSRYSLSKIGIVLGVLTILVHIFSLLLCSECFFKFYESYVFPVIRSIYDYTLGYLPFPFVYVVFVYLLWQIYIGITQLSKSNTVLLVKLKSILVGILNFAGWVVFLFYSTWGFNYYQPTIEKQLDLPEISIDSTDVINELNEVTILVNQARKKISADTLALSLDLDWETLEHSIRVEQEEMISIWGKSVQGRVRIRALRPDGILLRFSTAGIYIPFAFEGHVDTGMNAMQWPFTMAHEMAHGYGYTDEGACNFIGFLTCMRSKEPVIKYSGLIGYWRYLYFDVRSRYPEVAKQNYEDLTKSVQNDLKAIREDLDKYPDLMPVIRDKIYDSYLKSHGVRSGLQSYNEITLQVMRWKQSRHAFPFTTD